MEANAKGLLYFQIHQLSASDPSEKESLQMTFTTLSFLFPPREGKSTPLQEFERNEKNKARKFVRVQIFFLF